MVKLSSSSTVTLGNHWNAMEVGEKSEGRKRTSAHTSLHLGFVSCVCSFSFLSYSFISQQINKRVSACVLFVPYRSRLLLIVWIEWLRGEKTQLNSASITRRYGQTWRTWARDSGPCFLCSAHFPCARSSFSQFVPPLVRPAHECSLHCVHIIKGTSVSEVNPMNTGEWTTGQLSPTFHSRLHHLVQFVWFSPFLSFTLLSSQLFHRVWRSETHEQHEEQYGREKGLNERFQGHFPFIGFPSTSVPMFAPSRLTSVSSWL